MNCLTHMIRLYRLRIILIFALWMIAACSVMAQNEPAATTTEESKLKFADKIGHWLLAYGMSSPDFMTAERNDFKARAYAEVYVEAIIDHDAWMFNLLNRITKFRYEIKQTPHLIFEVKFQPVDKNTMASYRVLLDVQASSQVRVNISAIAKNAAAKHIGNKTYEEPEAAVTDIQNTLNEALAEIAQKLGTDLAPNLMVRYQNEVFWNGHEIPILEQEGNFVEIEAIDKDGALLPPAQIAWVNADPFESKGVVDMTGLSSKEVTLMKRSDSSALTVTVKRFSATDDINDLLKELIVEALSYKKQQALDTIVILKQDSIENARSIAAKIAELEAGNFQMEDNGRRFTALLPQPILVTDTTDFDPGKPKGLSFQNLRKRKKLTATLKRKINVAAFADLVVDNPDRLNDLLEELLANSGRLIARLILNRDSQGQRDATRNIVVDFLNQNLERIAGAHSDPLSEQRIALLPPIPPPHTTSPLKFEAGHLVYMSSHVQFPGMEEFKTGLEAYLRGLETPTVVIVNYSHDISSQNFIERSPNTLPKDLPPGYDYIVYTVVNIPGSVELALSGADAFGNITQVDQTHKPLGEIIRLDVGKRLEAGQSLFEEVVGVADEYKATMSDATCGRKVLLPFNQVAEFSETDWNNIGKWIFKDHRLQSFTTKDGKVYTPLGKVKVLNKKYGGRETTYTFADWSGAKADADLPEGLRKIKRKEITDENGKVYTVYSGVSGSRYAITLTLANCAIGEFVFDNDEDGCYPLTNNDCTTTSSGLANAGGDGFYLINYARSVSQQAIDKAIESLRGTAAHTAVKGRIIVTDNDTNTEELVRVAALLDEIERDEVIVHIDFDASGKPRQPKFRFGSSFGNTTIFQDLLNKAFANINVTPLNFDPITAILDGIAFLVGKLEIPARFYDPDHVNENNENDYNATLADIFYVTSAANPTSLVYQELVLPQVPGITSGKDSKYAPHKVELAMYCGLWNGIVDQAKGIPEMASWIIKMLTNEDNTRGQFSQSWKSFKDACAQNTSATYGGCFWDIMWPKIKASFNPSYPCKFSYSIGTTVSNLATFFIAFVKVGQVAKVAALIESLEMTTYLFRGCTALLRFTVTGPLKYTYKLGKATLYLVIETSGDGLHAAFKIMDATAINLNRGLDDLMGAPGYQIADLGDNLVLGFDEVPLGSQLKEILDDAGNRIQDSYGNYLAEMSQATGEFGQSILVITKRKGVAGAPGTPGFSLFNENVIKRLDDLQDAQLKASFLNDFANASEDVIEQINLKVELVDSWKRLLHADISDVIRKNPTYLSAVSKQISNYGDKVAFKFERVLPYITPRQYDNFFKALDNPKSIDHVRSLVGDFENIPGISLSRYASNSLPKVDIPAPSTWADPLLALPGETAVTFTRSATAKTLSPGQKIYRVLSVDQRASGGFWTYELPKNKAGLFGDTAVRPEWNGGTHYVEYTVPEGGLKVWDGPTAAQPLLEGLDEISLPGGGIQIFVPDPYRKLGNEFDNLTMIPIDLQ